MFGSSNWEADVPQRELSEEEVTQLTNSYRQMKEAEAVLAMSHLDTGPGRRQQILETIIDLEKKPAAELTATEAEHLRNLRRIVSANFKEVPTFVFVEDLLLKKLGPERFKAWKSKKASHQEELESLVKVNDELQRQVELLQRTSPSVSVPNSPVSFDVNSFGTDPRTGIVVQRQAGTYVVEVDERGVVTSAFLVTPKAPGRIKSWLKTAGNFLRRLFSFGAWVEPAPESTNNQALSVEANKTAIYYAGLLKGKK